MSTYKSIARRGSLLGTAFALVVATVPSSMVFADALNPLTERSLLLSSSAPGYKDTDGSGNATFAPPGSGPNGVKTGETFTFKVSSTATVKGFSLQYCTEAAGNCQAPGNNTGDARVPDRETNATAKPNERSDLDVVGFDSASSAVAGTDFEILVDGVDQSTGWTTDTANVEDDAHSGALSGKQNFVRVVNATGTAINANQVVTVKFNASASKYITNPGEGSFFVKINTYSDETAAGQLPTTENNIIDGGVTVANVMTDSIHITTKVLETMSFSVGTENRDTVDLTSPTVHGTCDPILQINDNRLDLGNPDAEFSLETDTAWDVFSYWRLSSNSSGGATVYYSGNTLANTVGDEIAEVGATETVSTPGTEQFGLGFVDPSADTFDTELDDGAGGGLFNTDPRYRVPGLYTLNMETNYDEADGDKGEPGTPATAKFAFEKISNTEPKVIAQDNDDVISCSTAKMRYIGNIGADTPAGVYTTKINYLAAPQY